MRYLKIRKGSAKRKDGSQAAVPLIVVKDRKFGNLLSEKAVSKKRSQLIIGAHDSGKTRWLRRLYADHQAIWGAKHKAHAVYLCSTRPISSWAENPHVATWWDNKQEENYRLEHAGEFDGLPWAKLKYWQRCEVIADYLLNTNAVLFIDDAHKLSGRKLQIARECVLSASLFVASASQLNRISPNLRTVMMRREPDHIKLDTDAAYDTTNILMWLMILVTFGAGAHELALVLGGLKMLGTGARAAKQN